MKKNTYSESYPKWFFRNDAFIRYGRHRFKGKQVDESKGEKKPVLTAKGVYPCSLRLM
jgi:hypothetical protein